MAAFDLIGANYAEKVSFARDKARTAVLFLIATSLIHRVVFVFLNVVFVILNAVFVILNVMFVIHEVMFTVLIVVLQFLE